MLVAKEVEIILNFSDCFRRFSRKQKETFKFIKNRQLIIFLFCVVSISIIVGIGSSINTLAVSIDGNQTILKSIDDDMERLANNSGIQWNWHDKVSQSNDGQLYKLNVSTTFSVKLLVDGNEYLKWVTGGTVDDILTEYGIILNSDDGMNYKHGDALFSGMTIDINRVNFKEYTMTEEIPFNTSSLDVVLPQGKKAPDNIAGVNGTKTITRRDTVVDGIVTGSQIISETIDKEPIHAINYVVKIAPEPTPVKNPSFSFDNLINNKTIFGEVIDVNSADFKYKKVLRFMSTAYSGDANSGGPRAANGEWLRPGSCAIDPRFCSELKMGDRLYITSADGKYVYGYATINDYGAGRRNDWIDLFIPNEAACNNWGRRDVNVYVLN